MARQAIPKRSAPAVVKQERQAFDASRSVNPYDQVIKDIMGGAKELGRQGAAAVQTIKNRFQKIKSFVK